MPSETQIIKAELEDVKSVFLETVKILPSFNITDKKVLPYGLKPHTRSVSWIVEQAITQQAKYHAKPLGLDDIDINMPDTCLHGLRDYKGRA